MDLVIEIQESLIPIEIKQSETARAEMAKEIMAFQRDFEGKAGQGYLIQPGKVTLPLGKGVTSLPLRNL